MQYLSSRPLGMTIWIVLLYNIIFVDLDYDPFDCNVGSLSWLAFLDHDLGLWAWNSSLYHDLLLLPKTLLILEHDLRSQFWMTISH